MQTNFTNVSDFTTVQLQTLYAHLPAHPGPHAPPRSGSAPSKTFKTKLTPHVACTEPFPSPLPGRRGALRSAPWRPLGFPPSRSGPGGGASAVPRCAARRSQTGWRAATQGAGATGLANWAGRDDISFSALFPKAPITSSFKCPTGAALAGTFRSLLLISVRICCPAHAWLQTLPNFRMNVLIFVGSSPCKENRIFLFH